MFLRNTYYPHFIYIYIYSKNLLSTVCKQDGSVFGGECQEGYYCLQGSSRATSSACPVGTYNPLKGGANSSACLPCPGGKSTTVFSI